MPQSGSRPRANRGAPRRPALSPGSARRRRRRRVPGDLRAAHGSSRHEEVVRAAFAPRRRRLALGCGVLIAARYLVDRLRHPQSRAEEVAALRRRFVVAARAPRHAEVEVAADLRRLREQLSGAFAGVLSCSRCARGHPLPHGRYPGGHCCGTGTTHVFTDEEVAALRLSGTTPRRLVTPTGDHSGCAFRGTHGCSLDVADRPNICVRYICLELERELRARGDLRSIRALCVTLAKGFDRLRDVRAETTMEPDGGVDDDSHGCHQAAAQRAPVPGA